MVLLSVVLHIYHPQQWLREGYALTGVCLFTGGGGLVSGGGGRYWWVGSILGDRFLEGVGIQGVVGKLYSLVLISTSGH